MHGGSIASGLLARGRMLLSQGRPDLAERELRGALVQAPQIAEAHALLALCLSDSKKEEALQEAKQAVGLAPDSAYTHYVLGIVYQRLSRSADAMASAKRALEIDPENAQHHSLIASLHIARCDWKLALASANTALSLDAEDVEANNLRAIALTNLGRKTEAGQTLSESLRRAPENAMTHANVGWKLLHEGKSKEAALAFRESLRLQPGNEWARDGLITALKARNPLYALVLRYFLFMGKLKPSVRIGLILGLFLLPRIIGAMTKSNPQLQAVGDWLIIAYLGCAMSTWLADPICNLLLRLHPLGKHALNVRERWQGNVMAMYVLLVLAVVGLWLATGKDLIAAVIACGIAALPATAALASSGKQSIIMWCLAGGSLLLVLAGIALLLAGKSQGRELVQFSIICSAVSTWVSLGGALSGAIRR